MRHETPHIDMGSAISVLGKEGINPDQNVGLLSSRVVLMRVVFRGITIASGDRYMTGQNDFKAAEQTYAGFLGFMKWGTIASLAVGALVILIIAR
jgi:Bacterial aa3 type cytochrome c oxidase subunit IV